MLNDQLYIAINMWGFSITPLNRRDPSRGFMRRLQKTRGSLTYDDPLSMIWMADHWVCHVDVLQVFVFSAAPVVYASPVGTGLSTPLRDGWFD